MALRGGAAVLGALMFTVFGRYFASLEWIACLPILWALREDTPSHNRRLGYLYGAALVFMNFRWLYRTILVFTGVHSALAYMGLLIFVGLCAIPYILLWGAVHPLRRGLGTWWVLAIPSLAVLIEFASTYVLVFPYQHGAILYRSSYIWQLVSVTGIWGMTWLAFFVNCAAAEGLFRLRSRQRWPWALTLSAALLLTAIGTGGYARYQRLEQSLTQAPILRVQQIQLDLTMSAKLEKPHRDSIARWVDETEMVAPGSVDMVVWPEAAGPRSESDWRRFSSKLSRLATHGEFQLVFGAVTNTPDGKRNTVFLVDRQGKVRRNYEKLLLLPFGEYMPGRDWFGALDIKGVGDFRAAREAIVVEGDDGLRLATPICYEAIFGRICRRFDDPNLIVAVTNDAWFGDTTAPIDHSILASARAVELGIPMVRSAYTGISFVVEPHGRILAETAPFEAVNRPIEVRMGKFNTIYARFGDWFAWLCVLVAAGAGGLAWRHGRSTADES